MNAHIPLSKQEVAKMKNSELIDNLLDWHYKYVELGDVSCKESIENGRAELLKRLTSRGAPKTGDLVVSPTGENQ